MHNVVNQKFVLISAESPRHDQDENETRSCELASLLRRAGMAYKWVVGQYNGKEEDSFLVITETPSDLEFMEILRKQFNQLCFLYVDSDRSATFHWDNLTVPAGRFVLADATATDCTYDPVTETYWVLKR